MNVGDGRSQVRRTYPEIVERGVGDALARDVLGQLVQHGVVGPHDGARDQLPVRAHGEVPRLDAHQVVERELQDQPAFRAHLESRTTNVE